MRATLLLLVLFVAPAYGDELVPEEPDNYCHDKEANKQWGQLLRESPGDQLLIRLFALRLGLCQLVDAGFLTVDEATEIFEKERVEAVTERYRDEVERKRAEGRGRIGL